MEQIRMTPRLFIGSNSGSYKKVAEENKRQWSIPYSEALLVLGKQKCRLECLTNGSVHI